MIKQTKYWIKDLTDNVKFIHTCMDKKVPFCEETSDELLLELEKRIMMSCYIIRKLNESKKINDELYKTEVELIFYPKINTDSPPLECMEIEDLYDLKNEEINTRYFSYIVNQIIHSHYFEIYQYFDETISGFYFNSDRSKKSGIYYVRFDEFFEALTEVASVYADGSIVLRKNHEGKFVKVWS